VERNRRRGEGGRPLELVFEAKDILARVKMLGDLFEPVLKLKQKLPMM